MTNHVVSVFSFTKTKRTVIPNDDHFQQLLSWLKLESEAEIRQIAERRQLGGKANAEQTGETLLDLAVSQHESSLGGRTLLTLVKRNRTLSLPWNRLRVGTPVVLSSEDGSGTSQPGVVSARRRDSIEEIDSASICHPTR